MASLYLASASPRRQLLLQQLGLKFHSLPQDIDESLQLNERELAYVRRLARGKAESGWQSLSGLGRELLPVLGADTAAVCDGDILGKPGNDVEALQMLARLSGRWHRVVTAVAVYYHSQCELVCSDTRVKFRAIGHTEARAYLETGEPRDKAGAYAVQGQGARFVERIEGSYSGVVGLPLVETQDLLGQFGIQCAW